jgi:hypothetical protein
LTENYWEGEKMKRILLGCLVLIMGLLLVPNVYAADKDAIKKQVDEIVVAIDGGKKADDFADAAKKDPYVFILGANDILLVHPSLVGQNLKEKAEPIYVAVIKGTPDGTWVEYEWQGKLKHTYVRKTKSNMIVGSGYSD